MQELREEEQLPERFANITFGEKDRLGQVKL